MRGAHCEGGYPTRACGLIPARAGSTRENQRNNCVDRAHPRPCGEHASPEACHRVEQGSSPPVRGAPSPARKLRLSRGLIPARAGSTLTQTNVVHLNRAHPRPCGEHWVVTLVELLRAGSSPPVRGAHIRAGLKYRVERAHPRPCGEHAEGRAHLHLCQGSSPPVRGARRVQRRPRQCGGLIPARAGSTAPVKTSFRRGRAHPRPCGEHGALKGAASRGWGSSPPVRGAPVRRHEDCQQRRAHPRPCGEHSITG